MKITKTNLHLVTRHMSLLPEVRGEIFERVLFEFVESGFGGAIGGFDFSENFVAMYGCCARRDDSKLYAFTADRQHFDEDFISDNDFFADAAC